MVFVFLILSKGFLSRIIKSASLPTSKEPIYQSKPSDFAPKIVAAFKAFISLVPDAVAHNSQ